MKRPVRIANASGFLGDRDAALAEMVRGGEVDFVTGDYLAELTMMVLGKQRLRDPGAGYAATFLRQLEPVLGEVVQRDIRVVVNAGGLNPRGLGEAVRALGARHGLSPKVAVVDGDDLLPRLAELRAAGHELASTETGRPLPDAPGFVFTANAYLGAWGIVRALAAGAEIVVCGRVTDASLTVGPAAFWHGWGRGDLDALAGAVVAGHVIECGAQATGGNYSAFREVAGLEHPGFPIAQVAADGSAVITKHPGTGGAVTAGTVTAQLVYEIGGPRYLNPDVTVLLDTVQLEDQGSDRVSIRGVRGPPPPTTKVAITTAGGHRNELTFVLTGLDQDGKAALLERSARAALAGLDLQLAFQRIGAADLAAASQDAASSLLRVVATSPSEADAGRAFSSRLVELALSSYPGLYTTGLPGPASVVGGYWPALIPQDVPGHRVLLPDGAEERVPPPPAMAEPPGDPRPAEPQGAPEGPRRLAPLGLLADARAGDKGSDANVGVWVRSDAAYAWLRAELTAERLRALVPEATDVTRHELPSLRALNFVVHGILAGGAAATVRFDRQAKALGELLRARPMLIPEALLAEVSPTEGPELVHRREQDGVITLILDSPANHNALSPALLRQLHAQVRSLGGARAVVLTGAGRVFCSGADLSSIGGDPTAATLANAALLADLVELPVPLIVQLNGPVRAGGLGLLGAADIVVAPEDATFAFTEVRVGAVPATIAATLIPRLDPRALQRYLLTGETFDAREAVRIGLCTLAVPADGVAGAVAQITSALRLAAPAAVRSTQELLADLRRRSLRDGLLHAAGVSARAFASGDAAEGIAAFLEKRLPRWARGD